MDGWTTAVSQLTAGGHPDKKLWAGTQNSWKTLRAVGEGLFHAAMGGDVHPDSAGTRHSDTLEVQVLRSLSIELP